MDLYQANILYAVTLFFLFLKEPPGADKPHWITAKRVNWRVSNKIIATVACIIFTIFFKFFTINLMHFGDL